MRNATNSWMAKSRGPSAKQRQLLAAARALQPGANLADLAQECRVSVARLEAIRDRIKTLLPVLLNLDVAVRPLEQAELIRELWSRLAADRCLVLAYRFNPESATISDILQSETFEKSIPRNIDSDWFWSEIHDIGSAFLMPSMPSRRRASGRAPSRGKPGPKPTTSDADLEAAIRVFASQHPGRRLPGYRKVQAYLASEGISASATRIRGVLSPLRGEAKPDSMTHEMSSQVTKMTTVTKKK